MRRIIIEDSSRRFLPPYICGRGANIWRGPIDGNGLVGEEKIDRRSVGLREVDLSVMTLETCLPADGTGTSFLRGYEKLTLLKAQGGRTVRLGGEIFFALLEDWERKQDNSHLEWLRKERGIRYLDFFGTVCRDAHGRPCVPAFIYCGRNHLWFWITRSLKSDVCWEAEHPSACLRTVV